MTDEELEIYIKEIIKKERNKAIDDCIESVRIKIRSLKTIAVVDIANVLTELLSEIETLRVKQS